MLLDSNILIYASKPGGEFLLPWLTRTNACVSIISRIEVLGWHGLPDTERAGIVKALRSLPELPLTADVASRAISLRQTRRIGLADSIIAGTAIQNGFELVTRNTSDFRQIEGLNLVNPFDHL